MFITFGKGNESDVTTLRKRILDLEDMLTSIQNKVKSLELDQDDLRNKVLRKIQFKKEKEEEEKPKDIYGGMFIPAKL